ncbi:translocation/assembly module TamB domain-containing protein [Flavobacterium sp. SUN052]|uniref:translocation/assembly module TamB domain-containing protein n=1 Tax=Flavobacterium sp. SUN052 TaxID=3002441 RepID=UPI00237DE241|nr:translocation/assembly module TamB domain-containing protein [Flavobacterium sp. SUN052]MEC4005137.1 translocation/assembly module TamB domain-containing protein [Flavobacterium sp. SUN052]
MLLIVAGIALSLPVVQTKIAHYITDRINKDYGTDINVDGVEINIFGGVQLKKVLVKDEKKDTLIYANRIITNILDTKKLLQGKLLFGEMVADNLTLNVVTYKGEKDNNLNKFVAAFDDGKPTSGKFLMTSNKITLKNCRFREIDYNRQVPLDVDFTKLNAELNDFKIQGPNVYANINKMSFLDHRGLFVESLKSKFTYTKKNIRLEELDFKTAESNFKGDVILKYDRKDFKDFNNKVIFEVNSKVASIATNDIRYFYKELGKNQKFDFQGQVNGALNNFTIKKLKLKDSYNSEIIGTVNFKNLFAKKDQGSFYMKGSFDKIASSYDNLTALLPNVLGKKLPSSLKKLGKFNLVGDAEITTKSIDADFVLNTKLGTIVSNLVMTNINNIDNATYSGNIILENFDIGSLLNRTDLGITNLDIDVDGKGFTEKYVDTKFSGEVKSIVYNGYNYKNILADGSFKKPIFKGKINVNDPNLFFDFDGIVDLSKRESIYDFHAKVDYANLKKLNFISDDISVFKGDVVMKISGSSLDNMKGDVIISNASYQNSKDIYFFDNLKVNSSFDAFKERTISLQSTNQVNGKVQGKFEINQIKKMIQNSLGSLYTNYKPNILKKGQYLKFNFSEFNEIVEILNPKISVNADAVLNGTIKGDDNDFKLNFTSKTIDAFDVHLDNVQLEVDNKNPLYNTYVQLDSIKTKYYKVRDFSLINVTSKDTLSFRTEFKGGEKGTDFYNLNLYHTIDKDKKNIIGFNKSEMMFKDYLWYINEKGNDKNKIVFDNNFKDFSFDDIVISHENQSVQLNGLIDGKLNKDLQLTFHDVNLNKITPDVKQFHFDGKLNGEVYLKQNNAVYQPTAALEIKELVVNDNVLGDLNLDIKGNDNFTRFDINSKIENENFKSFTADGNLQIVNESTLIDLDLNFQKFNLGVLSNLGGEVISNIRGFVTGNANLSGNVNNIDYNGRLYVNDAGLTIPYLNVDYKIKDNSIVDVTQNKFIIQKTKLFDTKFNTEGNLQGFIKHKQFSDWELDLAIDSDRILALNTKDNEDVAYFGTAFIDGSATIKGPTSGLEINVDARSAKGTDIKIPINDAQAVSENSFIHFLTKSEKYGTAKNENAINRNYNGLQMNFEFDITTDASIEVILDRNSGHGMKGKGRGTLNMSINTLGKFEMTGDYQVYEGTYNFKYGGIIDKKFDVKKYSSITWDGDPYKANLNLEAVSRNITANPAVLIENASFNQKIPVQVVIALKGTITSPEPDFSINFPNVSSVLKSEIETKLSDKDTRQKQALYLLSTGGFLSPEGISQSQITNSFYEKAGSLFGDLFNDKDGKINFDVSYSQGDKTALNPTNGRFLASISTQINERITINGKVGVPTGGVSETAIVGNFEMQYRVNEDGTLNLRVFNKENDINYIGQGIGYTQGAGVSYEVDFDTFKELVNKIFTKHKIDTLNKSANEHEDSSPLPEGIEMKKEKDKNNKTQDNSNSNKEAKPEED